MWNMGWTPWNCCGRQTVMECMPRVPIISNGPRFFSTSFLEGRVVWKNFAFTYTWSPILKAGDGIRWQSAVGGKMVQYMGCLQKLDFEVQNILVQNIPA